MMEDVRIYDIGEVTEIGNTQTAPVAFYTGEDFTAEGIVTFSQSDVGSNLGTLKLAGLNTRTWTYLEVYNLDDVVRAYFTDIDSE